MSGVMKTCVVKFIRQGVGISLTDVEYADSTSNTEAPTAGWQTNAPTWHNGHYIWTRTKIVYTDGTTRYSNPVCLPSGKGIVSIEEQYYKSTSATTTTGGSWQDTPPTWESGRYIWTRSKITYTDGTEVYTDAINATGSKGDKGDKGGRGPALRGPQDWGALPSTYYFYSGAEGETYKDIVLYNGNYYSCIQSCRKSTCNPTNSTYWQLADKVEIIASKILLSTYALIQNLGASAIEMKDPNTGQTLFYAKDGTVSCKVGIFENVTVSGTVKGVTGSFKWLDCVDSSGNVVGRICPSTETYGGVAFESVDMVQQGTKNNRSLRFYSADIWCRGGFGANHLNLAVVNGSTIKYYTKDPAESTYESKTMTSHTGDGKTYYDIELYSGTSGDASGFPVDLVIINNSNDSYAYRLVGVTGKKVTVICSNDYYGAAIAYVGGWLGMSGGETRPFVYVGSHYSPTTSRVGKGWFALEGCDNNWG